MRGGTLLILGGYGGLVVAFGWRGLLAGVAHAALLVLFASRR